MTSTVQVQKKEALALKDISPMWAEQISQGNLSRVVGCYGVPYGYMTLAGHKCCVVGEAHKFKDADYGGCKDCLKYSMSIFREAQFSDYKRTPRFDGEIQGFVDHWNEVHVR